MEANFKKSSEESSTFVEMIGTTEEHFKKVQEDFVDFMSTKKTHNVAMAAEFSLGIATTPEEAVIYTCVLTQVYDKAQRAQQNPLYDMMERLGR